jgi:NAD(P)-dependent dehydrogenase (short-subunit alcohol dehydrogenase family)
LPEPVDPHHLLLIGAGPGVGAGVVRRFGREGFRSTLISRSATLDQLAPELRGGGLEVEAIGADIEDLDGYRETLERIFSAPGAPGVVVYRRPGGRHPRRDHHDRRYRRPGTDFDPDNIA